jgi:hypothetical protein
VADLLVRLSAGALGVFAGVNVLEAGVLVPWWHSLPPEEFLAWYRRNDRRLIGFFGPLTVVTALLAVVGAVAAVGTGRPGRGASVAAAALMLVCVVLFPLWFQKVNARFAAGTIPADEVPAALARWGARHLVRTAISLGAVGAALAAV